MVRTAAVAAEAPTSSSSTSLSPEAAAPTERLIAIKKTTDGAGAELLR
jgi:hypothetical protein